jgi:hypothetical protein
MRQSTVRAGARDARTLVPSRSFAALVVMPLVGHHSRRSSRSTSTDDARARRGGSVPRPLSRGLGALGRCGLVARRFEARRIRWEINCVAMDESHRCKTTCAVGIACDHRTALVRASSAVSCPGSTTTTEPSSAIASDATSPIHFGHRRVQRTRPSLTSRATSVPAPPTLARGGRRAMCSGPAQIVSVSAGSTGRPAAFHASKPPSRSVACRKPRSCRVCAARLDWKPSWQTITRRAS